MKKYRVPILLSIILCLVLGFSTILNKKWSTIDNWGFADNQIKEYGPFWITVPAGENEGLPTDINGLQFDDEPDTIFLILPSNINTKKLVCYVRDGYDSQYEARRAVRFENGVAEIAGKTVKVINSDIPIMFIETDEENMPFSEFRDTYDRDAICSGKAYFDDFSNTENIYLKPRGNLTWAGMHKKPYTLVLENKENLLGMGTHKKWNLLADAYDKSCLKNYTFNRLAHKVGIEYEPEMKHILLYINGSYEGIYLLTEKVKAEKESVNLGKNDWLFIWGGSNPEQMISYDSKCWFGDTDDIDYPYVELVYPENDSEEGLKEKKEYIQKYMDAVEDESSDEYMDYLDLDSFVKFYWVQEASMNLDACYRSIYTYYRDSTKKLYYAPVWDMDLSLRTDYTKPGENGEEISFNDVEDWKIRKLAYYRELFEHPSFEEEVSRAYYEYGIRENLWDAIDIYKEEQQKLETVGEIEFKVWKNEVPEMFLSDNYKEHSQIVLDDYIKRLEWIDKAMEIN